MLFSSESGSTIRQLDILAFVQRRLASDGESLAKQYDNCSIKPNVPAPRCGCDCAMCEANRPYEEEYV